MIEILIFHLHLTAALYAFTKNWQKRKIRDAILALMIIGLFFTIGWALTSPVSRLMPKHLESIWFTRDTLSLVLLAIPESFFFYFFFVKDR
jgi:hypothetical protein